MGNKLFVLEKGNSLKMITLDDQVFEHQDESIPILSQEHEVHNKVDDFSFSNGKLYTCTTMGEVHISNKIDNTESDIKLDPMKTLSTKFIKQIACGTNHVLLLTKAGTLYTQGSGRHGVLGHGDEDD